MSRPRAYRHHMRCSRCGSNWVVKDGRPRGKQTYRCRERHYRFTPEGNRSYYSERVKRDALSMYCEELHSVLRGKLNRLMRKTKGYSKSVGMLRGSLAMIWLRLDWI